MVGLRLRSGRIIYLYILERVSGNQCKKLPAVLSGIHPVLVFNTRTSSGR